MDKIYRKGLTVRGDLCSSYCFTDSLERDKWIKEIFPKLNTEITTHKDWANFITDINKNPMEDKILRNYYTTIFSDTFKGLFDDYQEFLEYIIDFGQRYFLFIDVMRKRGNIMLEHYQKGMPPLIYFDTEEIMDARGFETPANFILLKIKQYQKIY